MKSLTNKIDWQAGGQVCDQVEGQVWEQVELQVGRQGWRQVYEKLN